MSIYGNNFGYPGQFGRLTGFPLPQQPAVNPGLPLAGGAMRPSPVAAQPTQNFVWGANGQKVDPRQRAMADTSPVGHWTEGMARVANALVGNMHERRDASRAAGFPDIPRAGFGFVNPFTAYTKGGGLY